uniref:Short chain amide porin n=1 Tax=Candidatus Kentrum sp. FW TaxID=2126338 RepID=A0A450SZ76_9GAMM|nr:MAG: short chain amide porin [Candidatus Kentron sp. FW]
MNKKPLVSAMVILTLAVSQSFAGTKFGNDENMWFSIGAGVRTSFNTIEDATSNDTDDFELDSIRLYLNGQIVKNLKFTFNAEREIDGNVRMLDGIARLEFNDALNIWLGRFLPPSDRSNLSGPYYLGTWDFPIAQAFPNIYAGRDNGAAVWGHMMDGKFKYQVGAFQGSDGAGSANDSNNLLYAGKATINFWEPEGGYYNASTYYGEKEVLTFGLTTMQQSDATGTVTNRGDFSGWSADLLMEKKLDTAGVVSLEGAYYDYDLDNLSWSGDTGGPIQGDGYFVLAGYLFPRAIGIGKLRPHIRHESFDADTNPNMKRTTLGLTYVMKGHNARITAVVGETDNGSNTRNFFRIGVQLQY